MTDTASSVRFRWWPAMVAVLFAGVIMAMPRGATRQDAWPWALWIQASAIASLAALGWQLTRRPEAWDRRWWPLAVCSAAVGASALFSRDWRFSLEVSLPLIAGLAWTVLWARGCRQLTTLPVADRQPLLVPRVLGLVLLAPLVSSVVLFHQELLDAASYVGSWSPVFAEIADRRNLHPFGHMNYAGGYVLLSLPWLVQLAWFDRGVWRLLWCAGILIGLEVFLTSSSRGAFLAGAVAFGGVMAWRLRWAGHSRMKVIAVCGGVLVVLAAAGAGHPRVREGIHRLLVGSPHEGDVQRIAMLQGGILLAKQEPILGHGAGMTPFVFPEVRRKLVGGVETPFQLHNGPLQIVVDHGVIGVAAMGCLFASLVSAARRRPNGATVLSTIGLMPFRAASIVSLGAYAVFFLTDYQFYVVGLLIPIALHAGLLLGTKPLTAGTRKGGSTRIAIRVVGIVSMAAAAGYVLLLIPSWRAKEVAARAWWTLAPSQHGEIAELLREAVQYQPRQTFYRNHLALERVQQAREAGADQAQALNRDAIKELEQSLAINPSQEPVHASLGWLLCETEPARAAKHFAAAMELLPDRSSVRLGAALCALQLNQIDAAANLLAAECVVNPMFIASGTWDLPLLAPLREGNAARLDAALAALVVHPQTPEWRKPSLRYARAFTRWWSGGAIPSAEECHAASSEAKAVFARARADAPLRREDSPALAALAAACAQRGRAADILRTSELDIDGHAINAALDRLRRSSGGALDVLRAPSRRAEVLIVGIQRNHQLMHRIPDGPGYLDIGLRDVNVFVREFAANLFPATGGLPGSALLELTKP